MTAVVIITAICLIGAIVLLIKGTRDAKEVDDNNGLLTQGEIDAFMARAKDRHLSELVDRWGKKKFGDRSENKRGFQNRSDEEVDCNSLSHIQ